MKDEMRAPHIDMMASEPHHQHLDILREFFGAVEPGVHRRAVAARRPITDIQQRRAKLVAMAAWEQLLRADVDDATRAQWREALPGNILHLADDYELMALFLWTWFDLQTAMVNRITEVDPAIPLFNEGWLRVHLPDHRRAPFPLQDKWLCPQLCMTCRRARVCCPACRTKTRFWPPSSGGLDRGHTIIKEVPPCGHGPTWSPDARQAIEEEWTQLVMNASNDPEARRNDEAAAQQPRQ